MRSSKGLGGRRKLLAGIVTVGLTLGGSAAYAFWSGGGPTGGSASTGSSGGGIVQLQQIGRPVNLTPGGTAQQISIAVTNSDPTNYAYLDDVTVTVDPSWSERADLLKPACTADDFVTTGPGYFVVYPTQVATVFGSIRMKDKPAVDPANNQDNCKGVDVDLIFTPVPHVAG